MLTGITNSPLINWKKICASSKVVLFPRCIMFISTSMLFICYSLLLNFYSHAIFFSPSFKANINFHLAFQTTPILIDFCQGIYEVLIIYENVWEP